MIEQTVMEQERALYWHRRGQEERTPRRLLRESDEIAYWLEECLVQDLKLVPGWLLPRLVALLAVADPRLPQQMGGERRPAQVLEFLYQAQEVLMERSTQDRRPARIIPLFG
ncbi:MAG TPA: hypothetical protein VNI34_09905 [Candidatus Nitrosotalea sp.]|nr:hypothetical protein [Candidatus Nitrosotalea sp.]